MLPVGDGENTWIHSMKLKGMDQSYNIKRVLLKNNLYSVYLISTNEQKNTLDKVLLIDHPPAKKPTAHLLAVAIEEHETTAALMRKIVDAVQSHFAEDHASFNT
jgi:hypothetical protein